MNSMIGPIASYLINAAWQVPLLAAAGWLASRLVKRLGPQAEHIAWVSTLMMAVLLPAMPLFRLLINLPYTLHAPGARISIALATAQGSSPALRGVYALPAVLLLYLVALYFASTLYLSVRLLWSLHSAAKLLRNAERIALTPDQLEQWERCKRSFSLHAVRIFSSAEIAGPAVVGIGRPALLLPQGFAAECDPQDLLAALAHECAHLERRDFMKNLFYEIASLALAFHPAIWFIKSQIAQTREMVCDAMVTETLVEPANYARSLLRLAAIVAFPSQPSNAHAIGIFDAHILEKRIMTMNVKKQIAGPALRYGLIIPATLFLLSVAVGGAAMAVVIEPQSQATGHSAPTAQAAPGSQNTSLGPIYKIGNGVSAPTPLHEVDAEYPKAVVKAKKNIDGISVIGLVVDQAGMPRDVHVVRSFRPDFDANAIKAVKQYRFEPAMRMGKPVAVRLNIEVNFKMY